MATATETPAEQIVRARIGAARLLLERVHGAPNHAALSAIQAAAVVEGLRSLKVAAEAAASLTERVLEVKWADGDILRVLEALKPAPAPTGRRASQDYEAVVNYATEDVHPYTRIHAPSQTRTRMHTFTPMKAQTHTLAIAGALDSALRSGDRELGAVGPLEPLATQSRLPVPNGRDSEIDLVVVARAIGERGDIDGHASGDQKRDTARGQAGL